MRAATILMEREPQLAGHNASATGQTPPRSASPINRGHALIDESPEERKSSKIKKLEAKRARLDREIRMEKLMAERDKLDEELAKVQRQG
ncbi:MAG: hypothetical protein FRX48_07840 [Lasallia pustulata]|uniref:Uncharacterized protein n=1 Tax=Lasallia pustulata TaxID=136370 RepID=A0A5M8PFJ2_9LECA|nr:MAG: hypothetical protein FRX48_07840 [Lasallia pustulata]